MKNARIAFGARPNLGTAPRRYAPQAMLAAELPIFQDDEMIGR